jgi:hypothetical protein
MNIHECYGCYVIRLPVRVRLGLASNRGRVEMDLVRRHLLRNPANAKSEQETGTA